jgi:uncharacterized peroxidase-related enzyme
MPFLKKLPADAKVFDAFKTWPHIYDAWTETCQQILRESPSALTAADRELIGTFVSKLNQCHYCYSVHNSAAKAYGLDPALVTRLVEDIGAAPVAEKLKPLLRYVRKLTLVQADADPVYAAGWSDDDLHIAIAITALFNFMNRFVHGLGIEEDPAYTLAAGLRLKAHGYLGSSRLRKEERDRGAASRAAE